MEASIEKLIKGNEKWVNEQLAVEPEYFAKLAKGQSPEFLWIGCADSRVPPNEITGTSPGDIFVHRNIANQIIPSDTNMLSVLQYAIEYLHVKHVIVCGHYGCGGINAAMDTENVGLVGSWIAEAKNLYFRNKEELDLVKDTVERAKRMVEINVLQQVQNVANTVFVQKAWMKAELKIHGWVFALDSGKIIDLNCDISNIEDLDPVYRLTGL